MDENLRKRLIKLNQLKMKAVEQSDHKISIEEDVKEYSLNNGHIAEIAMCALLGRLKDFYDEDEKLPKLKIEINYMDDARGIDLKLNDRLLQLKGKFKYQKIQFNKINKGCLIFYDNNPVNNINHILIYLNLVNIKVDPSIEDDLMDIWNFYSKLFRI